MHFITGCMEKAWNFIVPHTYESRFSNLDMSRNRSVSDVDMIAKFAQMEFKLGEPERGRTMFENILSNYPKRCDLWSVYIDMVTKLGDLEPVRWARSFETRPSRRRLIKSSNFVKTLTYFILYFFINMAALVSKCFNDSVGNNWHSLFLPPSLIPPPSLPQPE